MFDGLQNKVPNWEYYQLNIKKQTISSAGSALTSCLKSHVVVSEAPLCYFVSIAHSEVEIIAYRPHMHF